MKGNRLALVIYLIATLVLYFHQAYCIERTDFKDLFFDYSLLFVFYILIIERLRFLQDSLVLKISISLAISARMILLFYEPNLSDDFYRFLWDGNMLVKGENPYLILPDVYRSSSGISKLENHLFAMMNSPNYFTVYPPLNQLMFGIATYLSPDYLFGQVLALKSLIFLFELMVIFTLPSVIKSMALPAFYSAIYILNPLLIIETVGNLHFEGVSAAMLVLTFYFLIHKKNFLASIFLGLAAGMKLIPFLLFPLIWRKMRLFKGFFIMTLALTTFIVFFIPFINLELVENMSSSIFLYFQTFEFNASIYYIIREIGFWFKGYNIIASSGYIMAIVSGSLILIYSLGLNLEKWPSVFAVANLCLLSYYFLSTTVHPWYIINILLFSSLSGMYMTGLSWSFLVFLSYQTYSNYQFAENPYFIWFEYLIVLSVFAFEIRNSDKTGLLKLQRIRFDSK